MICRAYGLSPDPRLDKVKIESTQLFTIFPDSRMNIHVKFSPNQRIAPQQTIKWVKNGTFLNWVKNLSTTAAVPGRKYTDQYILLEILSSVFHLATFLD